MQSNTSRIAIFTIFTALYSVGVVFFAPISFGIFQVRIADILLPLSMIFGIPSALGFGLGAAISNVYGGLGIIDIIGGAFANLIACMLAWYIARKREVFSRFLGSIIETSTISLIVGGYLAVLFQVPLEIGLVGVMIGSLISINAVGFPLQELLRKNDIIRKFSERM